jgi:Transposase domain (DUF772)
MLLAVLLYAYCAGIRSSRQIERRCHEDIAFRIMAGNRTPDHLQAQVAELLQQAAAIDQAEDREHGTARARGQRPRAIDELMGHQAGRRGEREGSMIGTRYRHMTEAMQARVVAVTAERLAVALAVMPQVCPKPGSGEERAAC